MAGVRRHIAHNDGGVLHEQRGQRLTALPMPVSEFDLV
jgi:hypothetical protein